jgi:hypothetical protein
VLQYYYVLSQVLQKDPQLRKQLTRCKECRIFFLTDPRNSRRRDLRCPFGCRDSHRKESSARRSSEYYGTGNGKDKKKEQNARRNRQNKRSTPGDTNNIKTVNPVIRLTITAELLSYIQNLLTRIEHCFVSKKEILTLLRKKWRQHSIDNKKKEVIISNIEKIIRLRE